MGKKRLQLAGQQAVLLCPVGALVSFKWLLSANAKGTTLATVHPLPLDQNKRLQVSQTLCKVQQQQQKKIGCMHVQPYIRIDVMLHSLASQSVAVPLMRPPRVISPPLACRFLLRFFHSTMRYISLAGSELPCGVLVSGNFAISYRRLHRGFLCTSQWTHSAAHCGAC